MTTMNPAPELAPALKQLRLSGILDSLEARNREAIQGKLAYTDFPKTGFVQKRRDRQGLFCLWHGE